MGRIKSAGEPVMPVECDVVTLTEQRHSERSQRITVRAMRGLG